MLFDTQRGEFTMDMVVDFGQGGKNSWRGTTGVDVLGTEALMANRYSDDEFEYRHVQLPKLMLKAIPKEYHDSAKGTLKLLWEEEWRAMGMTQVRGSFFFFLSRIPRRLNEGGEQRMRHRLTPAFLRN
jgi:hypothetical protein